MPSSPVPEYQGPPSFNKVWTLEAVGAAGLAKTTATVVPLG